MRRILGIAAATAMLTLVSAGWRVTPNQETALQGAWIATSFIDTAGTVYSDLQPGLMVFTGTHYSQMYATGVEPRGQFADNAAQTDAEIVAAYRSFTANTGRYEVRGDTLTYRAFVAKNPNYMGSWPENAQSATFRIDGETLSATGVSGTTTYRRVEGDPVPW